MPEVRFDPSALEHSKRGNALRSTLLVLAIVALLVVAGYFAAGLGGAVVLGATACFYLFARPAMHPGVMLRMMRARELSSQSEIARVTQALAHDAGVESPPRVYEIPSPMLNAMALGGRAQPSVAVTTGLLRMLDPREIVGVIAHEISHLAHGDLRLLRLAGSAVQITNTILTIAVLGTFFGLPWLADENGIRWVCLACLLAAPSLALALRFGLSRNREFAADLGAAKLTQDPLGLASALTRLERFHRRLTRWRRWIQPSAAESEATPEWLRTHPATEERVRRLLELYTPTSIPAYPPH